MEYGDFSSLVQLGAGLHIGSALLQLYGEIGLRPINSTLARISGILAKVGSDCDDLREEEANIIGEYEVFKVQLFNEYRTYIFANSGIAVSLIVWLIVISLNFHAPMFDTPAVLTIAISVLPAPIMLAVFWYTASRKVQPIYSKAVKLEKAVFERVGG